jgi:hypothetical protein
VIFYLIILGLIDLSLQSKNTEAERDWVLKFLYFFIVFMSIRLFSVLYNEVNKWEFHEIYSFCLTFPFWFYLFYLVIIGYDLKVDGKIGEVGEENTAPFYIVHLTYTFLWWSLLIYLPTPFIFCGLFARMLNEL